MEIYVLDPLLRRERVIDRFISLIWTERYNSLGDFELKLQSNRDVRKTFTEGTMLAHNESRRVMIVKSVYDSQDDDNGEVLTVKGKSLETIMESRVAWPSLSNTVAGNPKWKIVGTPINVINYIFTQVCMTGTISPSDKIPFCNMGTPYTGTSIPAPTMGIQIELEPNTLYNTIRELCEVYDLGFALVRGPDDSKLYFGVYTGDDHTTSQTLRPRVIFARELDNLQNTSSLIDTTDNRNVAYVLTPVKSMIVVPEDINPTIDGFDRGVIVVKADDITTTDPIEQTKQIQARGLAELKKRHSVKAFDGEIAKSSDYKYGVHYLLGDLVETRDADGYSTQMRVTEQIFSSDQNGDKSYPTLSVKTLVTPGTWLAWSSAQVWQDLGTTQYWNNV